MIVWDHCHPQATGEMLGLIPTFLRESDPRPAREQFNARYVAGWSPFEGFRMVSRALVYPGDPPMVLLFQARLRDEIIRFYDGSWVAIVQPDGSYEIARMD